MSYDPSPLEFHSFDVDGPLPYLPSNRQTKYLKRYLADLGATSVLEEPQYFDRDYLAEFSAFYGKNVRGYRNICRRFHFFETKVDRELFSCAIGGDEAAEDELQANYLGFVVRRPIPGAALGRTVLKWYPERIEERPRIPKPRRRYHAHVAGLELTVRGLAWQQQDAAVSTCSTCSIWTMLHSSAFNERHAIPTTADIRRAAHRTSSGGDRLFPSVGMTPEQMSEAIKNLGLQPMMMDGDAGDGDGYLNGFEITRFASHCASLIRSGYPVLLGGDLHDGSGSDPQHALCLVGVREPTVDPVSPGDFSLQDRALEHLYIHDDNIGPQVRFELEENAEGVAVLRPSKPSPLRDDSDYPQLALEPYDFKPTEMLVAVHKDVRLPFDDLHKLLLRIGDLLSTALNDAVGGLPAGLAGSLKVMRVADYVGKSLGSAIGDEPDALSEARLGVWEELPPMSLHIGVLRIGLTDVDGGSTQLLDVLVDTTELAHNEPVFGYVSYHSRMSRVLRSLEAVDEVEVDFGIGIDVGSS